MEKGDGKERKKKEAKELVQDRNNLLGAGEAERETERDRETPAGQQRGGRATRKAGLEAHKCGLSWYV